MANGMPLLFVHHSSFYSANVQLVFNSLKLLIDEPGFIIIAYK